VDRVFDLAWTHNQVLLQQLNATEADAQLYGHLPAPSSTPSIAARRREPARKEPPRAIRPVGLLHFRRFPIVLLQIGDPSNIELVRQLVQAHAYWRLKGLAWTW